HQAARRDRATPPLTGLAGSGSLRSASLVAAPRGRAAEHRRECTVSACHIQPWKRDEANFTRWPRRTSWSLDLQWNSGSPRPNLVPMAAGGGKSDRARAPSGGRSERAGVRPSGWLLALLVAVALGCYLNSLPGALLYDDLNAILRNPAVAELDVARIVSTG